jgi:hypothetical protein
MSKMVTIETPDGVIELDADLLNGYRTEAFEFLREEAEQKRNFKDAVEAQAETLGISKKLLTKYLKASFKAKTKEARELGDLFTQLDEATKVILKIEKD